MGFFSRKEVVPELPPAPRLPDLPNIIEKRELPDLPVNMEIARPLIPNRIIPAEPEEKFDPSSNIEVEESVPKLPKRLMENMDFPKRRVLELNAQIENKPITKSMDPIYVRIDRFQSSKKNFDKIKEKVTEVEKTLRKIKDVKEKEESELDEWSLEIEKLKSRLSEIDSDIFSQL